MENTVLGQNKCQKGQTNVSLKEADCTRLYSQTIVTNLSILLLLFELYIYIYIYNSKYILHIVYNKESIYLHTKYTYIYVYIYIHIYIYMGHPVAQLVETLFRP